MADSANTATETNGIFRELENAEITAAITKLNTAPVIAVSNPFPKDGIQSPLLQCYVFVHLL